ncbi:MAG: hypothetical protein ACKV19_16815 [Verrucomicrobiales bacterium]
MAAGIEAMVSLVVSGFSLGRLERKKRDGRSAGSSVAGILALLIILGAIVWFIVVPKVIHRKVTLVAKDGYSLPFAALVVHTENGDQHERTDNAGHIVIPRFGTKALTVKDPRYVERTWKNSEIESELPVERTVLGSGLDRLADRLLKPAHE